MDDWEIQGASTEISPEYVEQLKSEIEALAARIGRRDHEIEGLRQAVENMSAALEHFSPGSEAPVLVPRQPARKPRSSSLRRLRDRRARAALRGLRRP